MPTPIPSVRHDAASRTGTTDKAPGQPSSAGEAEHALPARVVVELPDGDILLGEDTGRLAHEQPETASQPQVARTGAQPGSEQWLDLRRLLYATGLEAIVLTRKRATSIILGAHLCSVMRQPLLL